MEILLWLAPAAVATGIAAIWAAYAGRERRPDGDREAVLARIGDALDRDLPRAG